MKSGTMGRRVALGLAVGAAVGAFAVATPARAAETISLTAIDGYPPKALWVEAFVKSYIPEINKRLAKTGHYKINWNQAWSGQISKVQHVLDGLQKGLGDIGIVTSVFHTDKVPLNEIAYATPFVTSDVGLVARTFDELAKEYKAIPDTWAKYNQLYLTNLDVLDSYQMFFKPKVTSLAEFKGKKIASAGLNLRYLQNTGAVGVAGSLVHYYNEMKTGVIDGTMLWPEAMISFKIAEVAKYMVKADIGTANSKTITVNMDSWKKLPDEVKAAIQDASPVYRDYVVDKVNEEAKSSLAKFKAMGGTVTQLTEAERKHWAMTMPNVAKDWAADLEKRGLPARQILTAYMDKMRAAHQPILRQWDKE